MALAECEMEKKKRRDVHVEDSDTIDIRWMCGYIFAGCVAYIYSGCLLYF